MQLNTELTEILTELGSLIPESIVNNHFKSNDSITISVKTPNIFYKKYYLYQVGESQGEEFTDQLSEEGLKKVRNIMGQAYFNYFFHYSKQFSSKYYTVLYKRDGSNELTPQEAVESNNL